MVSCLCQAIQNAAVKRVPELLGAALSCGNVNVFEHVAELIGDTVRSAQVASIAAGMVKLGLCDCTRVLALQAVFFLLGFVGTNRTRASRGV